MLLMNLKNLARYQVAIAFASFLASDAVARDVAIVHIGVAQSGSAGIDNLLSYLSTDSRISAIQTFDVDANGVPTVAELSPYASVLVATDGFLNVPLTGGGLGTQVGNVLDDYVDAGGRVVLTAFAGDGTIGIDGDILSLAPFQSGGFNVIPGFIDMSTAAVAHFVFDGVSSFHANYASEISAANGGRVLARYYQFNSTPAILTNNDNSVIMINAFPGSLGDYELGTDFGRVFANALAIPEPNATALIVAGS